MALPQSAAARGFRGTGHTCSGLAGPPRAWRPRRNWHWYTHVRDEGVRQKRRRERWGRVARSERVGLQCVRQCSSSQNGLRQYRMRWQEYVIEGTRRLLPVANLLTSPHLLAYHHICSPYHHQRTRQWLASVPSTRRRIELGMTPRSPLRVCASARHMTHSFSLPVI